MAEMFGKYEVVEKIGEGGFGEVFKGRDPVLKRFVAIKTCKSSSQQLMQHFLREAEISARLQHPNVTTVFDFGHQQGVPYLVQEFLDGVDLSTLIRGGEPEDRGQRVAILLQVAAGLAHAHDHGVVHRDLKPQNLRVLPDGRVKIMDFGIAKLLEAEEQLTRAGMTMGTAGYLPPEQLQGKEIDHRADIFSFGVLTYELMTGRRPFEGNDISTIFYRIAHEDPAPMRDLWRECPPELERLVERCLRKDPVERWRDLAQLTPELEQIAAGWRSAAVASTEALPGPTRVMASSEPEIAPTVARADDYRAPRRDATRPAVAAAPAAPAASRSQSFAYRTAVTLGGPRSALALVGLLLLATALAWWLLWRSPAADSRSTSVGAELTGEASKSSAGSAAALAAAAVEPGAERSSAGASKGTAPVAAPDGAPGVLSPGTRASPSSGGSRDRDAGGGEATRSTPTATADESEPARSPRTVATEPAAATRAAARRDPPTPLPREPSAAVGDGARLFAILTGDETASLAENELGQGLIAAGFRLADASQIERLRADEASMATLVGGNAEAIAAIGRRFDAQVVIVGNLRSEAQASVGRFFTGRATLDLRAIATATGEVLDVRSVRIGAGGEAGKLEPSEGTAREAAAVAAAARAATEIGSALHARPGAASEIVLVVYGIETAASARELRDLLSLLTEAAPRQISFVAGERLELAVDAAVSPLALGEALDGRDVGGRRLKFTGADGRRLTLDTE